MATNTYVALDTKTTVGTTAFVTFTSIPSGYTDLRLVVTGALTSLEDIGIQFNGDTGSNYSYTNVWGNGSTTGSQRQSNQTVMYVGALDGSQSVSTFDFMNYSNTTTYKTVLNRTSAAAWWVVAKVGMWRSTAAINSIKVMPVNNFSTGVTLTLYGIAAEGISAKATGGAIYSDSTHFYHVFGSSGTFTPTQSLTCDYVVIAGGAGGGYSTGGGGGAGGLRQFTSQSLSATGYTVTVGGGGNGASSQSMTGVNGTSSSFNSISASGGGGGGTQPGSGSYSNGASGGSGGGASRSGNSYYGGSGNSGGYTPVEGYAGGNNSNVPVYGTGGGGGAGGVGQAGTSTYDGAGGIGATSALITAIVTATGVGQLVSGAGYLAGGGGGANGTDSSLTPLGAPGGYGGGGKGGSNYLYAVDGTSNTGGGGGGAGYVGGFNNGAKGGSGVVIIRYPK